MENNMSKIVNKEIQNYPFLDKPIEIYKTELGHTIIIAPKKGELINISTWVKTGSINENDNNSGISHFLEHLMFKGTKNRKAGEFDKILEAKGAIVNAATWKDYTFYYVTMPKGVDCSNFDLVLDLHSDMMLNAILPEEEIGEVFDLEQPPAEKRERFVVIEEIRMREDQPWTKVYNALNDAMYKNHPYKRDVIGTAQIISQMPQSTIMEYYKNWYTPSNMTTIVVGDFESEEIIDKILEKFNFEAVSTTIYPEIILDEEQKEPIYLENTSSVNTGFVIMGYHGASACDLKGTILLDIISIILGEGKSSRLQKNLIEDVKEPIFSVASSEQYHFRDDNTFFVQANFTPEYKEKALNDLKLEVEKLQSITDNELEKAKKKLKIRFADNAETVSDIGETIGYYMTVCSNLDMCSQYLEVMDNITKEDVESAVRKYLSEEKLTTSVLMPKKEQK